MPGSRSGVTAGSQALWEAYLAQPGQQQKTVVLDGVMISVLLNGLTTGGQLTVGRFHASEDQAPPHRMQIR